MPFAGMREAQSTPDRATWAQDTRHLDCLGNPSTATWPPAGLATACLGQTHTCSSGSIWFPTPLASSAAGSRLVLPSGCRSPTWVRWVQLSPNCAFLVRSTLTEHLLTPGDSETGQPWVSAFGQRTRHRAGGTLLAAGPGALSRTESPFQGRTSTWDPSAARAVVCPVPKGAGGLSGLAGAQ